MSFTITAEFPLGTFRGANQHGQPEPLPSVSRLHAALLSAAGFGPHAQAHGDALRLCEADEHALRWLEQHPPDGVSIPPLRVNLPQAVAYRDDGTIKQTKDRGGTKMLAKTPGRSVAVGGRFAWIWHEDPPAAVREALTALCADVPYLGTSESPVRLSAGPASVDATHLVDREATVFDRPGHEDRTIEVCGPGRTTELTAAHTRRLATPPASSRSAYGTDEWSVSEVPPREAVAAVRYRRRGMQSPPGPWREVILLPLSRAIPEPDRVRWAVAAHRALIRQIGAGAPPLVTGVYPADASRPTNRLALHLLDRADPVACGLDCAALLALLIPAAAEDADVQADEADVRVVVDAAENLRSIRGPGGRLVRITGAPSVVPAGQFWRPPAPGQVRLWRTAPPAVPDTRGGRGEQWTFSHAALLSVGFVWKDLLPRQQGRREDYYRNLARAVTDAGAAVVAARPVRTSDAGRYAHRVNRHAVIRPYTAYLHLGDLATPGTVAAIGQSRHLGGGLLMPHDLPEGTPLSQVATSTEVWR